MKKCLLFIIAMFLSHFMVNAQSPVGTWITKDDKRKVDIAYVKIYLQDGMLFGKVLKLLSEARTRTCEGCSGTNKGKSLVGMTLIKDLEPDGDKYWSQGKLLDPKSGRLFDCSIWLDDINTLKVRASFGISLIGRTQTWRRLD